MRNSSEPSRRKPLSELEALAMRFLWSNGPATADQLRTGVAPQHPMKDATVRTVLRRLEEKGYVSHRVEGRTFIYSGVERPENVAAGAIRQLLDIFCGGSVEQLLIGMVDHEVITTHELTELARKINRRGKERD